MTTGKGEAKKRALAGVISALLASSFRRMAPKVSGQRLNRINRAGTSQVPRTFLAVTLFVSDIFGVRPVLKTFVSIGSSLFPHFRETSGPKTACLTIRSQAT